MKQKIIFFVASPTPAVVRPRTHTHMQPPTHTHARLHTLITLQGTYVRRNGFVCEQVRERERGVAKGERER